MEFSFEAPPEPAPGVEHPCFDGSHGQTETLGGLLVRESLKFAEQNDGAQVLPKIGHRLNERGTKFVCGHSLFQRRRPVR
jgi:hypothetical protein